VLNIKEWKYEHLVVKRKLESLLMFPLILVGRLIAVFSKITNDYEVYFFFPFYHSGGAEKVHAQIANAIQHKKCVIYFTKKSVDKTMLSLFEAAGHTVKNISPFTDNKWLYFFNIIYRGYISSKINTNSKAKTVFNGQCNFAYKIAPWLSKNIKQLELIHSFNSFSYIRTPFLPYYAKSIMISQVKIEEHKTFYNSIKVPKTFLSNIVHINNAITIPENKLKQITDAITILYVGRNSQEKRIDLIIDIAKHFNSNSQRIKFSFLGIEKGEFDAPANCTFLGISSDPDFISQAYQQAHILIIASSTEGFPMVVIEAMANNCAIVATNVGDIPLHVKNDKNGYIIPNTNDELKMKMDFIDAINKLIADHNKIIEIGIQNRLYAEQAFSIEKFNVAYQQLIKN
jgi:L-malate glycosyltransferase